MTPSDTLEAERLILLRFTLLEELEPGVEFKAMFLWLQCPPEVQRVCAGIIPSVVLMMDMGTWMKPEDPSQHSALGSHHQSIGTNVVKPVFHSSAI